MMAEENTPTPEQENTEAAKPKAAAAAKAKAPKAPALEDKPFTEFMEQHFTPALKKALEEKGLKDVDVSFAKQKLPVTGVNTNEQYWQVAGKWQKGSRQFNLYFLDEDINGKKGFSCSNNGVASTIESFMIDERKATLDLLVMYTLQRLNGQKWLTLN